MEFFKKSEITKLGYVTPSKKEKKTLKKKSRAKKYGILTGVTFLCFGNMMSMNFLNFNLKFGYNFI